MRSITQREDHVLVETGDLVASARHVVVAVPPALALEIAYEVLLQWHRANREALQLLVEPPGDGVARDIRVRRQATELPCN